MRSCTLGAQLWRRCRQTTTIDHSQLIYGFVRIERFLLLLHKEPSRVGLISDLCTTTTTKPWLMLRGVCCLTNPWQMISHSSCRGKRHLLNWEQIYTVRIDSFCKRLELLKLVDHVLVSNRIHDLIESEIGSIVLIVQFLLGEEHHECLVSNPLPQLNR